MDAEHHDLEVFDGTNGHESRRYHALDSLRAAMMLMGVVLHAGLSYSHMPSNPIWPFKDARSSTFCDAVMIASGLFRMPVFFMIAGFFAALIFQKRSAHGLLAERFRRVAIPFVVGWLVTFPIVRAGFVFAEARCSGGPASCAELVDAFQTGRVFKDAGPIHLWFLEYLLIYYVAAPPVATRARSSHRFSSWFRLLMRSAWRPVALAALTAVPLLASPIGVIPTPRSFWPEPISLAAHAVFFAFGWALYNHADLLPTFARHAGGQIAIAIGLLPAAGLILFYRCRALPPDWFGALPPGTESSALLRPPAGLWMPPANSPSLGIALQLALAMIGSLIVWLLVFGVTGLFVRHLDRPVAWMRYLSGASYWIYLAHFPLMVWLPIAIAGLDLPALFKLVIVLTVSLTALLIVYERAIRGTAVGSCLDWRRVARKIGGTPPGLTP